MNRRLWLIGAGAGAFLAFLLLRPPATVAARWIGAESLRLGTVTGTLWSGSAASVVAGNLRLGETRWSLSPLNLLLGELSADVTTRLGDSTANGTVSRSFAQVTNCTGCRFTGPVHDLRSLFPALKAVNGQLEVEIATLAIEAGWPTRAVGTAKLSSNLAATVPGGTPDLPPATFEVLLNADPVPENGSIEAVVQDTGGPVQLSARIILTPPGNFQFAGRAAARPGAPPALGSALAILGPRAPDGTTQLTMTGSF